MYPLLRSHELQSLSKVTEYRSGIYDSIKMRHVHPVFVSSLGGTSSSQILLYCDQSGVNVLFIRPSDVSNSEHKLRQFSLTFYFRILVSVSRTLYTVTLSFLPPDPTSIARICTHLYIYLYRCIFV